MKFKKLVGKFEKLVKKHEEGDNIETEKLTKLQQLLSEKRDRYEARLAASVDENKRRELETRLRVVDAQLEKSRRLSAGD